MCAALKVAGRVRDGRWIRGAPTHVLAEFLTELEKDGWQLVPASQVAALTDEVERLRRELGHFKTQAVVAREAESERDKLEAEVARLTARPEEAEDALWRCIELSGADTSDGRPGPGSCPPLPERAVQEVKRLREEADEAYDEDIAKARAEGVEQERRRLVSDQAMERAEVAIFDVFGPDIRPTRTIVEAVLAAVLSEEGASSDGD
jgi:hypothetical protein